MDKDLKQKYDLAIERINSYQVKLNSMEVALHACKSSASYKLGHLLIHETKSFKDILNLFHKIKAIKKNAKYTIDKPRETSSSVIDNRKKTLSSSLNTQSYKKGISIIIPTYKGEKTIYRVLSSLSKQNMDPNLFEIIIVINGEKDHTETIIHEFIQKNPILNIRTFILEKNGASLARNKGIEEAIYQYTLLIDDDDSVSATYLSSMYVLASLNTIVLAQIINIEEDKIDSSNLINMQILNAKSPLKNPFKSCPSILTINACKLIPTIYMKQIKFNNLLKSGEDIVYFSELLSQFSFNYKIAKEAIYFRFITDTSVSRQPLSYEFNIIGRLLVISNILNSLKNTSNKDIQNYFKQLINSQISFMNVYLTKHPAEYNTVINEIKKREFYFFPYERLQKPHSLEV